MSTMWDKWPAKVKITHGRGRCVINIPAKWARDMGLDEAEYALIHRTQRKILEVTAFHGPEDYKKYIP